MYVALRASRGGGPNRVKAVLQFTLTAANTFHVYTCTAFVTPSSRWTYSQPHSIQ